MPRSDRTPAPNAANRPASEYVGTEGEDTNVTAFVNFIGDVPNKYGDEDRKVYLLRDTDGNQLRIFGLLRVVKGDRISFTGNVKRQDEWNGEKRTELNKVRNLNVVS